MLRSSVYVLASVFCFSFMTLLFVFVAMVGARDSYTAGALVAIGMMLDLVRSRLAPDLRLPLQTLAKVLGDRGPGSAAVRARYGLNSRITLVWVLGFYGVYCLLLVAMFQPIPGTYVATYVRAWSWLYDVSAAFLPTIDRLDQSSTAPDSAPLITIYYIKHIYLAAFIGFVLMAFLATTGNYVGELDWNRLINFLRGKVVITAAGKPLNRKMFVPSVIFLIILIFGTYIYNIFMVRLPLKIYDGQSAIVLYKSVQLIMIHPWVGILIAPVYECALMLRVYFGSAEVSRQIDDAGS